MMITTTPRKIGEALEDAIYEYLVGSRRFKDVCDVALRGEFNFDFATDNEGGSYSTWYGVRAIKNRFGGASMTFVMDYYGGGHLDAYVIDECEYEYGDIADGFAKCIADMIDYYEGRPVSIDEEIYVEYGEEN